jgi:hypothetical protein
MVRIKMQSESILHVGRSGRSSLLVLYNEKVRIITRVAKNIMSLQNPVNEYLVKSNVMLYAKKSMPEVIETLRIKLPPTLALAQVLVAKYINFSFANVVRNQNQIFQ